MARIIRYHPPGALVHMISSFSFGDRAFEIPGARAKYLALAGRAVQNTDWVPIAYGLMPTHPHWALIAGTMPPRSFYHSIHTGFGLWVNQQRRNVRSDSAGRFVGHVFAKRPSTFSIAPEDAPRLVAYLHNNPVQAGIAGDASLSNWTSHRAYLRPAERPSWLSVSRALDLCGVDDSSVGRRTFHDLVCAMASDDAGWIPGDADIRRARRQLRQETNAPAAIGSPHVSTAPLEWSFPAMLDPTMPIRARWRGSIRELLGRVAIATRVSTNRMRSRSRERAVCLGRRVAVLTWVNLLNRPLKEIAQALGISSAAASKHLRTGRSNPRDIAIAEGVARHCWANEQCEIKTLQSSSQT